MRQKAEALAIQALSFIAGDSERLGGFLAATGLGPAEIRAAAREQHFLAGVLDHLLSDDNLLLAFTADAGVEPKEVIQAQATLGGRRWERDDP